jgi:hypothetical protein
LVLPRFVVAVAAALVSLGVAGPAVAEDVPDAMIVLKGDAFTPSEVRVKAGKPLVLSFTNNEAAAAEIEGKELKIEKVVPPGETLVARVRPLKPGRYLFVNEFREDVAKAYIVAE